MGSPRINIAILARSLLQFYQERFNFPDWIEHMAADYNISLEIIRCFLPGSLHIRNIAQPFIGCIPAQEIHHSRAWFNGSNVFSLGRERKTKSSCSSAYIQHACLWDNYITQSEIKGSLVIVSFVER